MNFPEITRSSEPYSDYGNLSGRGARRLLGAPAADALLTAIRESVQNSWDARRECEQPSYRINIRTLRPSELGTLRGIVFKDLSGDPQSELKRVLENHSVTVMEIADYGTVGLSGATRPSAVPEGKKSNFVSFLRNIGAPNLEISGSGGTYGYGKSSLFTLSKCQTIIVDSLTAELDGYQERRFMASRMGEEFHDPRDQTTYTGRHWWGAEAEDGMVDPILGEGAARVSAALGMPERSNDSGTTVMILEPDLGDDTGEQSLADHIRKVLLWYFWPKMVPRDGELKAPMGFSFCMDGREINIPAPQDTQPFTLFSKALQAARRGGNQAHDIMRLRPQQHLGWMADQRGPVDQTPAWLSADDGPEPTIPRPCHHVALMRSPELVVKYLQGNPLPNEDFGWAGVFIASSDPDVEAAFALAEPATHDDWNAASLGDRELRSFVSTAMKRIRERMNEINPSASTPRGTDSSGLAGAADAIGRMIMPTGAGDRAVTGRSTGGGRRGGGGAGRGSLRVSRPEYQTLELYQGRKVAIFVFEVSGRRQTKFELSVDTHIVGEGNERVEAAPDGSTPEIVEWELGANRYGGGDYLQAVLDGESIAGKVRIVIPADVAIKPVFRIDEV